MGKGRSARAAGSSDKRERSAHAVRRGQGAVDVPFVRRAFFVTDDFFLIYEQTFVIIKRTNKCS